MKIMKGYWKLETQRATHQKLSLSVDPTGKEIRDPYPNPSLLFW